MLDQANVLVPRSNLGLYIRSKSQICIGGGFAVCRGVLEDQKDYARLEKRGTEIKQSVEDRQ